MLGSVKQSWNWVGSGKHPAVGDFFKVGQFSPILEAIADWLENGFQRFMKNKNRSRDELNLHNSWRFWMRSPKADQLVVGVVRDSSDSLGRSYPLLVAGTGPFKKVEKNWDLLPFACEKIWGQMEYLGTGQFADVTQIEDRVCHIYPPDRKWFRGIGPVGPSDEDCVQTELDQMSRAAQEMEQRLAPLLHLPEFVVTMNTGASGDPLLTAGLWHKVFKNKLTIFPNALFMGGVPERTCVAVFQRPLSPPDFIRLWSAHEN